MKAKEFFQFGDFFRYFFRVFKKQEKKSSFLTTMHWINRISIVMFLIALLVMLYRAFLR